MSVPGVLTAAERFHIDSARSPITPAMERTHAGDGGVQQRNSLKNVK